MNRKFTITAAALSVFVLAPLGVRAQSLKGVSTKHIVAAVDNGTHRSLRAVGKTTRNATKTIGKDADKAERAMGKDVRKATKSVGKTADKIERGAGKMLGFKK